ncbi:MAG: hypothetical protein V8R91_07250 [Butyricimonas faecihominis]
MFLFNTVGQSIELYDAGDVITKLKLVMLMLVFRIILPHTVVWESS